MIATLRAYLVAVAVVAVAGACIESPLGGGFATAPACPPPSGNSAWTSSGISILRRLPDRCPFVVQVASSYVDFSFDANAGKSNIPGSSPFASLNIVDWQGYNRAFQTVYWFSNPNDASKYLAEFDVTALPGATINVDGHLQDTARFDAFTSYGDARGVLVLNGSAELGGGSLIGPANSYAGNQDYFRAQTGRDTLSYNYRWTVNGNTVSGATDASETLSFPIVGTYVVKALAERADLTVDTLSKTINVTIGAAFSGNSVLAPYQNYNWQVAAIGGTGPYTFEWYLDANYLTTGTSYSNAFNANESHWFDVKVTDALGNVGWSSFQFYTTNEGGGENQLRLPGTPSKSPATGTPRKRPPQ